MGVPVKASAFSKTIILELWSVSVASAVQPLNAWELIVPVVALVLDCVKVVNAVKSEKAFALRVNPLEQVTFASAVQPLKAFASTVSVFVADTEVSTVQPLKASVLTVVAVGSVTVVSFVQSLKALLRMEETLYPLNVVIVPSTRSPMTLRDESFVIIWEADTLPELSASRFTCAASSSIVVMGKEILGDGISCPVFAK